FSRPAIPTPPGLTGIVGPNAADPTISLASIAPLNVAVMLDHPHPEGSTGLTEAVLAMKFDAALLKVTAADITLGTIPSAGANWQLRAVVDSVSGEIGIELYSDTPILTTNAGSLLNIAFHSVGGGGVSAAVQIVDSATPLGEPYTTLLADGQG